EEIALAAFVHAQPGREQLRIQDRLVADLGLLEDFRFQDKLDEFLRPPPLQHQLAALVINRVEVGLGGSEPRIWHLAELEPMLPQIALEQPGVLGIEFAGVAGQWFHSTKNFPAKRRKVEDESWPTIPQSHRNPNSLAMFWRPSSRQAPAKMRHDFVPVSKSFQLV